MAEYNEIRQPWKVETYFQHQGGSCSTSIWCDPCEGYRTAYVKLKKADVAPVVHGRWVECDDDDHLEDAYNHHKCTNCNTVAPFNYKYREDWDEGMDGEWYPIGIIDDGINEHLTPYCPNCGAKMKDGETHEHE